ncbi:MAG TPA: hypothetical protein VFG20_18000 [Planctomycetaceae bacterium]|nr:hypothetical protein [Planctomycetaceae bacterium]
MALCRYKTMLSYLPGMATVVNAFESPAVQESVFKDLMQALNVRMEQEGVPPLPRKGDVRSVAELKSLVDQVAGGDSEIAHDLISGDSIHAVSPKG